MVTFKRKDNYNDDFLKIANDFLEAGILIVPNKDCLKGYYAKRRFGFFVQRKACFLTICKKIKALG